VKFRLTGTELYEKIQVAWMNLMYVLPATTRDYNRRIWGNAMHIELPREAQCLKAIYTIRRQYRALRIVSARITLALTTHVSALP